jgi:hypothetical protein
MQEMAATYRALPPARQKLLREGALATRSDMVARDIALTPDTVRAMWIGCQMQATASGATSPHKLTALVVSALAAEVVTPGSVL